jgi:RNA polymerase sigma-70 factor, ECF subfamily
LTREAGDEELLARFISGDEAAFNELMRRHEDRIFGLALSITGDRGDALEATQETFMALWRKATSFQGRARFGTWLYRIGINAARDQVRKRSRMPLLEAEAPPEAPLPGDMESVSLRLDLARGLATLPPEYREAVVMHDLGDIPYEEIARITDVALGTVKSRISRGRRLLAKHLEPEHERPPSKGTT